MDKIDDFYLKRQIAFLRFIELTQNEDCAKTVQYDVERLQAAYDRGDLKFIKSMDKELGVIINEYSLAKRKIIYRLIEELTGVKTDFDEEKRQKKLNTILKRGRIINRDEYELVHAEIDEFISDPSNVERVSELDRIMMKYSTSFDIE